MTLMKRILLLSFLLSPFSNLIGQSISGTVHFPTTNSLCLNSSLCCNYDPTLASLNPVANVKIEAENLVTGATDSDITDASGDFTVFVGLTGTNRLF